MASYYATDFIAVQTGGAVVKRATNWGPAIAATALIAALLGVAIFFMPGDTNVFDDAVVYVDCGVGHGSGMVIDRRRGYILTNRHVVVNSKGQPFAETFTITLGRGTDHVQQVEAKLKEKSNEPNGRDSWMHDWAVLEISKGPLPKAEVHFADSTTLNSGAKVKSWGFPKDAENCRQVPGSITELPRTKPGAPFQKIIHSATIAGGNSGGPLTLEDNTVIGMNVAAQVVRDPGKPEVSGSGNVNYAIPSHELKQVLDKYAHATFR